ncbi:MAG: hypothetical protein HYX71_00225 [Opitutae bacterium]|nr:hypothetical protein [Opitutae bacterium]
MSFRSLKSIAALSLLALPALLAVQTSSAEEERLQKLMADSSQLYVPKNHVSVGFRLLSSGGKVGYGSLGTVASNIATPAGSLDRVYNNGAVNADALRANEKNADGTQSSTPGGRYATFATITAPDGSTSTVQVGDFLSYTAGLTRNWAYSSAAQVTNDGRIAFSTYSASSDGGAAQKDSGPSGGVEFEFSRVIGNLAKRVEWGFAAGVALNGINNKTSGAVTSTLNTKTDFYSLNGQPAPAAPYVSGSAFVDFIGSDGNVYPRGLETAVPLGAVPVASTTSSLVGGTTVKGNWQVKGAYFLLRVGPSLRARLTERIGLNASFGVAGAYAGSTYSAVESFAVPNLADVTVKTPDPEQSSASKFVGGYYADLNIELAVNTRTGFFGGFSAQKISAYDQTLGGRTARIDIGSSVGVRGGVSFRF